MDTTTPSKTEQYFDRRSKYVPRGVGIFHPSTAVSAKGAVITDADGRELIDFGGGIGVLNAGHCPDKVVEAIQQQAAKLIHTCFHVSAYAPYLDLAKKLATLFPHGEATKVMLTNTGAESVENAIKIARQATGRPAVVAYTGAFHGRSMMAMTLTSKVGYKTNCGPFAPEVYRLPFPDRYHLGRGMDEEAFSRMELRRFDSMLKEQVAADQIAAVIIEPVQGEGGFNVVPKPYLQGLRELCDQYDILLIIDEVQSGFGRTGEWAAYQHYDVTPDLSTWAKSMGSGMPIGCVIGRAEIMDAARPGTIGGTYLGNPVSCAASLATIEYMEEVDINRLGREVGEVVRQRFEKMKDELPVIGDVRGLGAMMAMELVKKGDPFQPNADLCKKLVNACAERGLILLTAGIYGNVIRVLSPLTIDRELLNKGLDIIEEELHRLVSEQ